MCARRRFSGCSLIATNGFSAWPAERPGRLHPNAIEIDVAGVLEFVVERLESGSREDHVDAIEAFASKIDQNHKSRSWVVPGAPSPMPTMRNRTPEGCGASALTSCGRSTQPAGLMLPPARCNLGVPAGLSQSSSRQVFPRPDFPIRSICPCGFSHSAILSSALKKGLSYYQPHNFAPV